MTHSEEIKNISLALLAFSERLNGVTKDSKNPFFKSNYASLGHIQDTIKPYLIQSGLVYSQMPEGENTLTTMLIHAESGEYFKSTYTMIPEKKTPQGVGSCITYQKRYALAAFLGLNTDYDDDGNAASTPPVTTPQKVAPKPALKTKFDKNALKMHTATVQVYLNQGKTVEQIKEKMLGRYSEVTPDVIEAIKKMKPNVKTA